MISKESPIGEEFHGQERATIVGERKDIKDLKISHVAPKKKGGGSTHLKGAAEKILNKEGR